MDDLISRQAVIDMIDKEQKEIDVSDVSAMYAYSKCKTIIKQLPSELGTNLAEVGTDCISRQTAISAICNACGKIDCDKMDKCEKLQLPPANSSEFPNNSDTISRQAAIDALCAVCGKACDKSKFVYNAPQDEQVILCPEHYCICTLPSAQPQQIVRCKDCKHRDPEDKKCDCGHDIQWQLPRRDDWYCADAERREVTNGN